jgi:hypothetical protein
LLGWQLSKNLRTDLALDALEMGMWTRTHSSHDTTGLIAPSDKGVQYLAVKYTQRLAEAGAVASVGSTSDSYDSALAEAFNSLFKAELVRNLGPWKNIDDLEIAVAEYIDWFNHRRLHGQIGLVRPVEFEQGPLPAQPRGDYRRRVSSESLSDPARDTVGLCQAAGVNERSPADVRHAKTESDAGVRTGSRAAAIRTCRDPGVRERASYRREAASVIPPRSWCPRCHNPTRRAGCKWVAGIDIEFDVKVFEFVLGTMMVSERGLSGGRRTAAGAGATPISWTEFAHWVEWAEA